LRDRVFFNLSRHKMCQLFGIIFERTAFVRAQGLHNKSQLRSESKQIDNFHESV
jgi:hypothetical protein